jgi:predicted transcriptional regulator
MGKKIKIRAESDRAFFERARKAARAIDAGDRRQRAAELSFASPELLFKVLTVNRWALLKELRAIGPSSIRALAKTLGRDYRGVHADVKALMEIELVECDTDRKILVPWSRITTELAMDQAA